MKFGSYITMKDKLHGEYPEKYELQNTDYSKYLSVIKPYAKRFKRKNV